MTTETIGTGSIGTQVVPAPVFTIFLMPEGSTAEICFQYEFTGKKIGSEEVIQTFPLERINSSLLPK